MLRIKHILICCVFYVATAEASWQGPIEVVKGEWGTAPGEIAMQETDSGVVLPMGCCVTSTGYIVVGDDLNSRIQVFKADGNLLTYFGEIKSDSSNREWPTNLFCFSNSILSEREKYKQVYELTGELKYHWIDVLGGVRKIMPDDSFITRYDKNYYKYSSSGQLIKTYSSYPMELGEETLFTKVGNEDYKATIKYDDITYKFRINASIINYLRDNKGYLNVILFAGTDSNHYRVNKYDDNGILIAFLDIPANEYDEDATNEFALVKYLEPFLAFNGDVYVARIADNYTILKWAWQDEPKRVPPTGPDTPENLGVTRSIAGLDIEWDAPPQDPGCVTGYEIYRSSAQGGPYSMLVTLSKGTFFYRDVTAEKGKTYYYKLRALCGNNYSPYTTEVSGKR